MHFHAADVYIFSLPGSKDTHQNLLLLNLDTHGEEKNDKYELPIFSFSSIVASTNNFSMENKLGEGGFGPVYKVSADTLLLR